MSQWTKPCVEEEGCEVHPAPMHRWAHSHQEAIRSRSLQPISWGRAWQLFDPPFCCATPAFEKMNSAPDSARSPGTCLMLYDISKRP